MTKCESDLVDFFWNYFPKDYLERVIRSVFDCYKVADECCSREFKPPEAANLRPFYRRALIEGQLRDIAESFTGITAEARRSPAGPWNHTLVLAKRVALTQNAVGDPQEIVRPSLFRQMYAARDNQQYLFADMRPEEPAPDSILYGILIHGRTPESHIFPGFAHIVFPMENLQSYWPDRIDLFSQFPQVVRCCTEGTFEERHSEEEVSEPVPQLRTDIIQAGDGA